MMKKHRWSRACVLVLAASCSLSGVALAQDAETAKLLKEIEAIRELLENSSGKNNARALATITSALASPKATYDFYMACVKEMQFEEEGKRESEWREWRDANEETLRESEHLQARQLQLRYLALSIRAAGGRADDEKLKVMMPELIVFMDTMTTAANDFEEHRNVLAGSVLSSVFGERLKLNLTVDSELPWVYSPLNVSEIYELSVMPYYRRAGDAAGLSSAWDRRMVHEGKIAALPNLGQPRWRRGDDRDRERMERREDERTSMRGEQLFREDRLPELRWGKAKDALQYGSDPMGAMRAMTGLVKANLDHRKAREWLDELAEIVANGGRVVSEEPEAPTGVTPPPVRTVPDEPAALPEPPTLPNPPTLPE